MLLLSLAMIPAATLAQDEITDDQVNEIAKDINCPVCESTPLDVCPTQACADWRELIRVKLGEGQSREEILDYFARQYGDGVITNPPRSGLNLIILWLVPALGLLLGLLLFARLLGRLRTAGPESTGLSVPDSPAVLPQTDPSLAGYVSRVEEEIDERS
jgi:cytochrome c-type biogenesis protein CcmH